MTKIENTIPEIPTPVKAKRGRPINPERHIDGKYKSGPLDPEYFKKYWQKMEKVQCDQCCRIVLTGKLTQHKKSAVCLRNKAWLDKQKDDQAAEN